MENIREELDAPGEWFLDRDANKLYFKPPTGLDPSTATIDGQLRSRITATLMAGSVVTTPRHHLDVVCTEYGAAEMQGRTVRERAAALAEIAHPDFRDELFEAAAGMGRGR